MIAHDLEGGRDRDPGLVRRARKKGTDGGIPSKFHLLW
jgi:hypothetical protein